MKAWEDAQVAERKYHCDEQGMEQRRAVARAHRRWYAGMLEIPTACDRVHMKRLTPQVVAEFGSGPQGMILESPLAAQGSFAIDPLRFLDGDEDKYAARQMRRIIAPAESLPTDLKFDEAWVCNCLQHTMDPDAVMRAAVRALTAVRVFEWVDVPTDRLHLHTLTEGQLTGPLTQAGFVCVAETRGERAKRHPVHGDEWRQRFYAGVWVRR